MTEGIERRREGNLCVRERVREVGGEREGGREGEREGERKNVREAEGIEGQEMSEREQKERERETNILKILRKKKEPPSSHNQRLLFQMGKAN